MTNLSPNLETILQDRSLGSVPMDVGSAGFILGAQWGAVNKAMNVSGLTQFKKLYGSAIYDSNHISWATVAKYLEMNVGGAKLVRAGKDDYSSKNAVKLVNVDATVSSWNNGNIQFRKLNSEDDAYKSIEVLKIKLEADPTGAGWTVGGTLSVVGDSNSYGTIEAIILNADNTGTNAYVYLKDYVGTIEAGDTLTDGGVPSTAVISALGVTVIDYYNTYFHEVKLTLTALHANRVSIGSTIVKGTASGVVVGKATNDIFVTSYNGTFTAGDVETVDGVALEAGTVTITTVTATDAVKQAGMIFAKYPGSVGNDIQVAMCGENNYEDNYTGTTKFSSLFDAIELDTDEVAVVVTLDGSLVEKWICSIDETATRSGESIFLDTFLEKYSNYIGFESNPDFVEDFDGFFALTSLVGGASDAVDLQSAKDAYDVLLNTQTNALVIGDFHELETASDYPTLITYITGKLDALQRTMMVTTLRKDAINPLSFDVLTSIADILSIDCRWLIPGYEWEQYNNSDIRRKYWIPVTGTNVGIIVRSITRSGDIEAPAGLRRGQMTGSTRLYYNLEEGSGSPVSELYKYGVNANVVRILDSGQTGFYFWGNRTKYNPLSDMSRINVVSALITDIKKLGSLILPYIFEGIDELTTFSSIRQSCDAGYLANRSATAFYLGDGDGGYRFTCDKSNNDAQSASEKTIYVDFEVKYRPASEYIKLRITVTGAGVEFQFA